MDAWQHKTAHLFVNNRSYQKTTGLCVSKRPQKTSVDNEYRSLFQVLILLHPSSLVC
jgi:hypothetical protein